MTRQPFLRWMEETATYLGATRALRIRWARRAGARLPRRGRLGLREIRRSIPSRSADVFAP